MSQAAAAWLTLCLAAVLILPGAVALELAGHRSRGLARLALAPGVSVTLWPLALLWSTQQRLTWSPEVVRLAVAGLAALAIGLLFRAVARAASGQVRPSAPTLAVLAILLVAIAMRVVQARGLVVTPWVDGYHHTLITQLTLDAGAVPSSWRPYLPVDQFFYHFGFHAVAAAVVWVSGIPAPQAVLWTGQALSALIVLPVFALALRLTRTPAAAVAAAAVPATLFLFPAYYLTWGRYTQLAGLVALPATWVLLADASASARPIRGQLLAAATAAGLLLVHYRVFVFFLIGALLLTLHYTADRSRTGVRHARISVTAVTGGVLAAPWLVRNLWPGVQGMAANSPFWYRAPLNVNDVPEWLFVEGANDVWLALAAVGILFGLLRGRRAALGLVVYLSVVILMVSSARLGLPASWVLPPFALAISAFIPAALGLALLAEILYDLAVGQRADPAIASRVLLVAILVVTIHGAWRTRSIVNPVTIIVEPADIVAADWVRQHTPPEACFLVSAGHWHLNTYRGLDGGYWLPILAARPTTMPAAFYNYGEVEYARAVLALAETVARGDALTDDELEALMAQTGADHLYVGPGSSGTGGALTAEHLQQSGLLEQIYNRDGAYVFRRAERPGRVTRGAESVVCQPVARAEDPARSPASDR